MIYLIKTFWLSGAIGREWYGRYAEALAEFERCQRIADLDRVELHQFPRTRDGKGVLIHAWEAPLDERAA